ncbi:MAG: hypothetical protein WBA87_13830 [Microbacterium sp.]
MATGTRLTSASQKWRVQRHPTDRFWDTLPDAVQEWRVQWAVTRHF